MTKKPHDQAKQISDLSTIANGLEAVNDRLHRRLYAETARRRALETILAAICQRHADEDGYSARVGGVG